MNDSERGGKRRNVRRRQPKNTLSPHGLALVMNAMLVGVGGVFVVTTSALVTAIAATAAFILSITIVLNQR